jgi:hypothetical protein
MDDRFDSLEKNLAMLVDSVARLERRLAALEAGAAPDRIRSEQPPPAALSTTSEESPGLGAAATATRLLSLVGRSLLVLAGAFLLRAVTDAGTVPTSVGIGLGFVYAAVWLAAVRTAARGGRRGSAIFHGVCSAVIGYPLIWEATTTFQVLSPELAVLAIAGVTGIGLAVAWGCGLRSVAWVFTVAAVGTTVALVTRTPMAAVSSGFFVLLGLVTLWIARSRDWFLLPWLPALVADLFVIRTVAMAAAPVAGSVSVSVARLLVAALVVGYVGTVGIQVLARRRPIDLFDVIQTVLVLAVGVAAVERLAVGSVLAGAAVVLAGAACYAAAFTVVERQSESGRNFVYVSTLAVALLLIGSSYLGGELIVATVWAALGLLSAFLGSRLDRMTLRVHGAVFATAAAIHGGLLTFAVDALTGPVTGAWRQPSASVHIVLAIVTASMAVVASSRRRRDLRWWFRLPLVALVVISAAGLCAEVVRLIASPSLFDIGSAAGLAMVRTGIVSVGTLVLAALATRLQIPELRWVVYPILCALGIKILLQDLPAGRPISIAVAFVFFGAALILSPRLLRTHDRQATAPDSPNAVERLDSGHAPS